MACILVVDDSETLRTQVAKLLVAHNHTVLEADNGIHGIAMVKHHTEIGFILCDVNMPDMDGLSMCEHLFRMGYRFPIFMLTTESSKEMKVRGKSVGVTAWVTKPYVAEKLINAIDTVLKQREAIR